MVYLKNKNYKELSDCPEYQAWIDSGGTMKFPGGEHPKNSEKRCAKGFEKVIKECRYDRSRASQLCDVVERIASITSICQR